MKDFLRGMGSALDVFPSEKEVNFCIPRHTDEEALRKDWEAVGFAIQSSMDKVNKENDRNR